MEKGDNNSKRGVVLVIAAILLVSIFMFSSVVYIVTHKDIVKPYLTGGTVDK